MKRLSKQTKIILLAAAGLALMAATIPAAIWLTHTETAETGHDRLLCAQHNQADHRAYLHGTVVTPAVTMARRCDTLTVINLGSRPISIAIFSGRRLLTYDGATSRTLVPEQPVTITLLKSGHYELGEPQTAVRGGLRVNP